MDKSLKHNNLSKHKNIRRKKAKYLSNLWIEELFLRLQSIEEILKENIELTT